MSQEGLIYNHHLVPTSGGHQQVNVINHQFNSLNDIVNVQVG